MDDEQIGTLWEKAVLGRQIEEFLNSEIGKYLLKKADKDWQDAIIALRDCSPDQLVKLQADMKRAESIREWLISAVEEGLRATGLIQELQDEDEQTS